MLSGTVINVLGYAKNTINPTSNGLKKNMTSTRVTSGCFLTPVRFFIIPSKPRALRMGIDTKISERTIIIRTLANDIPSFHKTKEYKGTAIKTVMIAETNLLRSNSSLRLTKKRNPSSSIDTWEGRFLEERGLSHLMRALVHRVKCQYRVMPAECQQLHQLLFH